MGGSFHGYVAVYQRVNLHFPMVFLWFCSYVLTIVQSPKTPKSHMSHPVGFTLCHLHPKSSCGLAPVSHPPWKVGVWRFRISKINFIITLQIQSPTSSEEDSPLSEGSKPTLAQRQSMFITPIIPESHTKWCRLVIRFISGFVNPIYYSQYIYHYAINIHQPD